jgi:hypothetical protein
MVLYSREITEMQKEAIRNPKKGSEGNWTHN